MGSAEGLSTSPRWTIAGHFPMMPPMFGNRPPVWFALAFFLLGLAGPVAAQSGLGEKQAAFLADAGRGRTMGHWIDLDTNQLVSLRKKVEVYAADIPKFHQVGGLVDIL